MPRQYQLNADNINIDTHVSEANIKHKCCNQSWKHRMWDVMIRNITHCSRCRSLCGRVSCLGRPVHVDDTNTQKIERHSTLTKHTAVSESDGGAFTNFVTQFLEEKNAYLSWLLLF